MTLSRLFVGLEPNYTGGILNTVIKRKGQKVLFRFECNNSSQHFYPAIKEKLKVSIQFCSFYGSFCQSNLGLKFYIFLNSVFFITSDPGSREPSQLESWSLFLIGFFFLLIQLPELAWYRMRQAQVCALTRGRDWKCLCRGRIMSVNSTRWVKYLRCWILDVVQVIQIKVYNQKSCVPKLWLTAALSAGLVNMQFSRLWSF